MTIDFGETLQQWDAFGVNYVETAQTRNYRAWPPCAQANMPGGC